VTAATRPWDARVGDVIPAFRRRTDLEQWNRFAAVNDEFVGIHMDDAAAVAAGYPSAIGMGNLQWAYVHNGLRDWLGDAGRILSLSLELRKPNVRGQVVSAVGEVTRIERNSTEIVFHFSVWTESDTGDRLGSGTAVLSVFVDG
jgi:hypothetical protein